MLNYFPQINVEGGNDIFKQCLKIRDQEIKVENDKVFYISLVEVQQWAEV